MQLWKQLDDILVIGIREYQLQFQGLHDPNPVLFLLS